MQQNGEPDFDRLLLAIGGTSRWANRSVGESTGWIEYNGSEGADAAMKQKHDGQQSRAVLSDTSPEAETVLIELYRRMPGWQKLRQVSELTRAVQELALADIQRRHPEADSHELKLRLASRWLSAETMRKVFDWDPDKEGY